MLKQRYHWIDNIRACAIISMIIYHGMWNLVYLYGVNISWFEGRYAFLWQQSICWTFILLSGFCWSFSKNPIKQGLMVSLGGIVVTIITTCFSNETRIVFGILTMLGAAALLMVPLRKVLDKMKPGIGFGVMFCLFAVTYSINDNALGIFGMKLLSLPNNLYKGMLATFLGFTDLTFYSAGYFSLMPWCFLYFSGYFFVSFMERK